LVRREPRRCRWWRCRSGGIGCYSRVGRSRSERGKWDNSRIGLGDCGIFAHGCRLQPQGVAGLSLLVVAVEHKQRLVLVVPAVEVPAGLRPQKMEPQVSPIPVAEEAVRVTAEIQVARVEPEAQDSL
jgi:hypothetical protein